MKCFLVAWLLATFAPSLALAQSWEDYDYENLEFRGIGLESGGVRPVDMMPAAVFGVRADLGYVGPRVRISPAIRFWSSTLRSDEVGRLADQILRICARQPEPSCPASLDLGEVHRSDLELSTDAHWFFPTGNSIEPYVGGGLGLHLLNGRGELIDDTFVEDLLDTMTPGINLLGGLNVPIGSPVQLVAEARFVLGSDMQYVSLALGGTWALPRPPTRSPRALRPSR